MHFYSWGDPANLRNRKVRTREKRGTTYRICIAYIFVSLYTMYVCRYYWKTTLWLSLLSILPVHYPLCPTRIHLQQLSPDIELNEPWTTVYSMSGKSNFREIFSNIHLTVFYLSCLSLKRVVSKPTILIVAWYWCETCYLEDKRRSSESDNRIQDAIHSN
jgi:hypothetical protein